MQSCLWLLDSVHIFYTVLKVLQVSVLARQSSVFAAELESGGKGVLNSSSRSFCPSSIRGAPARMFLDGRIRKTNTTRHSCTYCLRRTVSSGLSPPLGVRMPATVAPVGLVFFNHVLNFVHLSTEGRIARWHASSQKLCPMSFEATAQPNPARISSVPKVLSCFPASHLSWRNHNPS